MKTRRTISIFLISLGFVLAILGKFTLLVGLPFFVIGVVVNWTTDLRLWTKLTLTILPIALYVPFMFGFWYLKNKSISHADTYIFPQGFRGHAVIAFNIDTGDTIHIENERRIFTFDSTRLILTRAVDSRGLVDMKFFFKDSLGQLFSIPLYPYFQHNSKSTSDSLTTYVYGWHEKGSSGDKNCKYKFYEFTVCADSEFDSVSRKNLYWDFDKKIRQLSCGH